MLKKKHMPMEDLVVHTTTAGGSLFSRLKIFFSEFSTFTLLLQSINEIVEQNGLTNVCGMLANLA